MGLTVSEFCCARAGRPVIVGLGFELQRGEALLLTGPNGAGKSTLLRALAGLLPYRGHLALDGISARDRDAWSERLAYAGHLDAIKQQLTLEENLGFWAALLGARADAPRAALAAFGLERLAARPAHACSAGQKRRLGLARLLLVPRQLWLLDEPTVSLDAESAERLGDLVGRHCAAGGLAVVATHAALGFPARKLRLESAPTSEEHDPFLAGSYA